MLRRGEGRSSDSYNHRNEHVDHGGFNGKELTDSLIRTVDLNPRDGSSCMLACHAVG